MAQRNILRYPQLDLAIFWLLVLSVGGCGSDATPGAIAPTTIVEASSPVSTSDGSGPSRTDVSTNRAQLLLQDDPTEVTVIDAALAIAHFNLPEGIPRADAAQIARYLLRHPVTFSGEIPGDADLDFAAPAGSISLADVAVMTAAISMSLEERRNADFSRLANSLLGENRIANGQILRRPGVPDTLPPPTPSPSPSSRSSLLASLPPIPPTFGRGTGTLNVTEAEETNIDTSVLNDIEAIAARYDDDKGNENVSVIILSGDRVAYITLKDPGSVRAGKYNTLGIFGGARGAEVFFQEGVDSEADAAKKYFALGGGSVTVDEIGKNSLRIRVNSVKMQAIPFDSSGRGSFIFDGLAEFDGSNN
ncbi:MAG: hypothetical protein AAFY57_11300 [Cyanobacteria bacterium J06642_2]